MTDPDRWQTCSFSPYNVGIAKVDGTISWFQLELDAAGRTVKLTRGNPKVTATWKYTKPDPDHLVFEGNDAAGKSLRVALHRKPTPPLIARGFRWINEFPFNR